MSWTNVTKATGTGWIDLPKPISYVVSSTLTFTGGIPIGLLLALTQSSITGVSSVVTSKWTDIAKPFATSWTDVPKPN